MKKVYALFLCLLMPLILLAQAVTEPTSTMEAFTDVYKLLSALGSQNWLYAAALVIVIAVWALRKYVMPNVPTSWLPVVSSFLGVLVAIAANISNGNPASWLQTVLGGVFLGNAASGFWSLVVKKIIELVTKKSEEKAS